MYKARFENNQLWVNEVLYNDILEKYDCEDNDGTITIETNNSASNIIDVTTNKDLILIRSLVLEESWIKES